MKRTTHTTTNIKNVSAILTADWHLREDQPICRTDNFWDAQWKKVEYIQKLQVQHQCPVIHAGDLFEMWKPSPLLLSNTIKHIPKQFSMVYGNHDVPQHNIDLSFKCGVDTLKAAGVLEILEEAHWGQSPTKGTLFFPRSELNMLVWHIMTWKGKEPWPGITDSPAKRILSKFPEFDLIVTGHNHQSFTEEQDNRILVNPGSLTRYKADQEDHKPCVYLWDSTTNTAWPHYLPIDKNVVSREHIDRKDERDKRINAFVERLNEDWEADVSFEENLDRFEKENNIRKSVMEIVRRAIES